METYNHPETCKEEMGKSNLLHVQTKDRLPLTRFRRTSASGSAM